jgi:hypothetical protein
LLNPRTLAREIGDSASCRRNLPFCASLTHCATVADIERAIDDILKAYA